MECILGGFVILVLIAGLVSLLVGIYLTTNGDDENGVIAMFVALGCFVSVAVLARLAKILWY